MQIINKSGIVKIRNMIWPVQKKELKQFLMMSLLFVSMLFVFSTLSNLGGTLVVSLATEGCVECINVIDIFLVAPCAILSVTILANLISKFGMCVTFYIYLAFFMLFITVFTFILYPLSPYLHASQNLIHSWQVNVPYLKLFWPVIGNWTYSLFYVVAELWGSLMISALFWQTANFITPKSTVKRLYSLYALVGNIGLILSGSLVKFLSYNSKISVFYKSLKVQTYFMLFACILIVIVYKALNINTVKYINYSGISDRIHKKTGMIEIMKIVLNSKLLILLSFITISYCICVGPLTTIWKIQVKTMCPDPITFNSYSGNLSIFTALALLPTTVLSGFILQKFSWKNSALIVPILIISLGSAFYTSIMLQNSFSENTRAVNLDFLKLSVILGVIQISIIKGIKNTLFNTTKQISYSVLDDELKTKGQAAVEVIGHRFGKIAGSILQILLVSFTKGTSNLSEFIWIIFPVSLLVGLIWILSILKIHKIYVHTNNL